MLQHDVIGFGQESGLELDKRRSRVRIELSDRLTWAAVSLLRMIFSRCGGRTGGLSVDENSSEFFKGQF